MSDNKIVTIDGVEYEVLGFSDGTDYGYQPGDGYSYGGGPFTPYDGEGDCGRTSAALNGQELRPIQPKASPARTNAELLKACAKFLVDDIRGLDLDSVPDTACATALLAKFIEELDDE